ncbi:hypothetical protein K439DRAFT_1399433 [Ramaria rubella]|nr:hypothetical protein K439DRAFT_1399433 [Ramaria rubella]
MGAGQSTEKVIYSETPIQFSNDLVNRLSDELASPKTNPAQQSILDDHVRSRIQAEIARLREEEEEVKAQIERALQRENIDRERSSAVPESEHGDESSNNGTTDGAVRSSTSLMEDLREVQTKVERFQRRRGLDDVPDVKATSQTLVECYRANQNTSLDCWKEVAAFKKSVGQAEQKFIDTFR